MRFEPSRKTRRGSALAVVSALAVLATLPASAGDLIVRGPAAPRALAPARTAPGVVGRETVRVDAAVLVAEPETLWLELVPGVPRLAFLTDLEHTPDGGLVWRGRFAEDDPGYRSITLSHHEGLVYGSLEAGAVEHTLRPAAAGSTVLITVGAGLPFHCPVGGEGDEVAAAEAGLAAAEPGPAASPPPLALRAGAAAADDRTIHIQIAHASSLTERWGGRRFAVAYSHHAVDTLNTTFMNSRLDARARLAAVEEWDSNTTRIPLMRNQVLGDSRMRAVRDATGSDLVVVLTDDQSSDGSCGIANLMTRSLLGPQMESRASSVTNVDCEGRDHKIFIHEIGHVLGAQHPPETATPRNQAVFPYAFAYNEHVYTIMAGPFFHSKLMFSNPSVVIDGGPAGIEDDRDNARALHQTIPIAAAWRAGGSEVPRNNAQPPLPPPPKIIVVPATDLRATVLSATEVRLRWEINSGSLTAQQVEAREVNGDHQVVVDLGKDVEQHVVRDLHPATTYRFRVLTIGPDNVAPSEEVRATTRNAPPAAAPAFLEVDPLSASAVNLRFDAVPRATGYEVEVRTADPAADAVAPLVLGDEGAELGGLAAATPYGLRVRAVNGAGASDWSPALHVTTLGPGGPCAADAATLCLLDGRFEVRAQWRNPRAPFGHGLAAAQAAPGSERTGLFTFFDPANVELVVKMLDGRAANGAFWHFYGALSDVEYWVSVRDTADGAVRTYHNDPFEICGQGDTTAFVPETPEEPEEPATSSSAVLATVRAPVRRTAAAEGSCLPGDEALCLAGGRFRVEVAWQNPHGTGGQGTGRVYGGLGGDVTGHFWFFRPDNLELSVKILDGRSINGHFWVLWGALSDVGYTIRVTDTESGTAHDFENPPLTLCGGAVTDVL